jgi:hypothetical protein
LKWINLRAPQRALLLSTWSPRAKVPHAGPLGEDALIADGITVSD